MEMRFGPANKALKAALPAIRGDQALYAIALFDLGLANYSLGKPVGDKTQMREGIEILPAIRRNRWANARSGGTKRQVSAHRARRQVAALPGYRFPVFRQMIRGAPSQSLHG